MPPFLQIIGATYLRLVLDKVLDPGLSRLLYLDIDMIVTSSLANLWATDLGGHPCAMVADPGILGPGFAERSVAPQPRIIRLTESAMTPLCLALLEVVAAHAVLAPGRGP